MENVGVLKSDYVTLEKIVGCMKSVVNPAIDKVLVPTKDLFIKNKDTFRDIGIYAGIPIALGYLGGRLGGHLGVKITDPPHNEYPELYNFAVGTLMGAILYAEAGAFGAHQIVKRLRNR